ncbi:MAG: hypothetical protein M1817_003583 [Caeruleum heppii]|nr:MAG: hypothetical protein M1817_003583 [Caeruleum heppii]
MVRRALYGLDSASCSITLPEPSAPQQPPLTSSVSTVQPTSSQSQLTSPRRNPWQHDVSDCAIYRSRAASFSTVILEPLAFLSRHLIVRPTSAAMKLIESLEALSFSGIVGRRIQPSTEAADGGMYDAPIDRSRDEEYPMLKDTVYLDHAGTTLYAKSLIDRFSQDMTANLFGNPHSASPSSQLSSQRIDDARLSVLQFLKADPPDYDVIFVANATAAIKLVMDAFKDAASPMRSAENRRPFWYGYHRDSHSSLVGVREVADAGHRCFRSDTEVDHWLSERSASDEDGDSRRLGLFAYPAQSNLNGRRLPLHWPGQVRRSQRGADENVYTMLDASALLSTTSLDLSDVQTAPDFTVFSFYKIFGFPDLGALVVRRDSGQILQQRRYFGGGTVDMVTCMDAQWYARKTTSLHDQLEDGTLPFHSIIALQAAFDVHRLLYGTMEKISKHTTALTKVMFEGLTSLRHGNGVSLCEIYRDSASTYGDAATQGAVVAFNVRNSRGEWIGGSEVEGLASVRGFHIRTGGLCNPGGIASFLDWSTEEMKANFEAGKRCGDEMDLIDGRLTGVIRVSLGAMSNLRDVHQFVDFLRDCYVEGSDECPPIAPPRHEPDSVVQEGFWVDSLVVYPVKSCGGWPVPPDTEWKVNDEGLALDREWCLVHLGTGHALSQKTYPRMALILPTIDLDQGVVRVRLHPSLAVSASSILEISISLGFDCEGAAVVGKSRDKLQSRSSRVCGDDFTAQIYESPEICDFFTSALGVPCTLARFPRGGSGAAGRHAKDHLRKREGWPIRDGDLPPPILLSNESPILTVTRPSLDRLNREITATGGKMAQAAMFRPNIVLSVADDAPATGDPAYVEDTWEYMQIERHLFELLGPCRRCQMVCIDPETAERNPAPLMTLNKTRRIGNQVYFGQHTRHLPPLGHKDGQEEMADVTIRVGDRVKAFRRDVALWDGDREGSSHISAHIG